MSTSRIVQLAQVIARQTAVIDQHIVDNNLVQPSFQPDGPVEPIQKSTAEVEKARVDVLEATIELKQLLEGPVGLILPEVNFSALAAIHRFKIARHVPLDTPISFADLADKCELLEHDLKRIVRFAIVHHRAFSEPKVGFVAHTAASKLLRGDDMIDGQMSLTFEECYPAHAKAVAQRSEESNVSGYAIANNTSLAAFEFLAQHPHRERKFAMTMSSAGTTGLNALSTYFDWSSLPLGSLVVDVGGSKGHASAYLARKFNHLSVVVQDLPSVIENADLKVIEDIKDRIQFVAHDMFHEQPVRDASVYLFRYVMHDWSDKYCIEVLQKLIPALRSGARVVIQDHLLPEPGTMSLLQEMQLRIMLSLFNSRERDEHDWRSLFVAADERYTSFEAKRVKENPSTGVMIVRWM